MEGVDAVFVGRVDLAVAMRKAVSDAAVLAAVEGICETARRRQVAIGMFTPDLTELTHWRALGASFFLLSSDHSFILEGANALASTVRES